MQLICYLSNGFPTLAESAQLAQVYAAAGCDVIEVDLPARDPYLEGEFIAGRMATALTDCDDYQEYMNNIVQIAADIAPDARVLLLAYEATLHEVGVQRFIDYCLQNDFMDVILVGLDGDAVKDHLIANGIRVSCYVQLKMDPDEIAAAQASNGFVYLQAKSDEMNPDYPTLADAVAHLRSLGIERPIYCGVGVATPADFAMVQAAGADGAFVGSTILKLYDRPEQLAETIREFKAAVQS